MSCWSEIRLQEAAGLQHEVNDLRRPYFDRHTSQASKKNDSTLEDMTARCVLSSHRNLFLQNTSVRSPKMCVLVS